MKKISSLLSKYRLIVLLSFIVVTGLLFHQALQLPIRITLEKFFPHNHPFVKLNKELGSQFGGTNTMLVMVKNNKGNIYNTKTIKTICDATDFFLYKPYVFRSLTASVTLQKSKYTIGKGMGVIESAPLFPPDFDNTQKSFEFVKAMVSANPMYNGLLVSDDGSAGLIVVEIDENINYNELGRDIKALKKTIESDGSHSLSFTGRPVLLMWIYDKSKNIYMIIGIVMLIAIAILYYFFRDVVGVAIVMVIAIISTIWGMGFMGLLKYELSPLMLILPVLISTRAISHSIQLHARFVAEVENGGGNKLLALENTFYSMLIPNVSGIAADAIGFFVLYIIQIGLLQEIAISMGIWVSTLIPLSGVMMPIMCTYLPINVSKKKRSSKINLDNVAQQVGMFSTRRVPSFFISGAVTIMLAVSMYYVPKILIGDPYPGSSLLFPNSDYNQQTKNINHAFSKAGADGLTLFFVGENDSIKKPETLKYLDKFERYIIENSNVASGAWSLVTVLKTVNVGLHDADPKWDFIPDDNLLAANMVQMFSMKNDPSEFARYTDPLYKIGNTVVFFKDHTPDTISQVEAITGDFFKENPLKSKYGNFYFAGGSIGLEMAVDQVVKFSHKRVDLLILVTVFILCVVSYRSFVAGIILVFPLFFANLFVTALMSAMGIGITIDTLPVVAIGVGIGVDFGIYLISRMKEEMLGSGNNFDVALNNTLTGTGNSIIFSGITMTLPLIIVGLLTDIRFQSQMSILIGVILFINMIWAITLQPMVIHYIRPRFLLAKTNPVRVTEPISVGVLDGNK